MANELAIKEETQQMMAEIHNTQEMCRLLMQAPHYKRMGAEGIYAIVEKAKSIGVSPLEALNGGMYYVQGKVELTSAMMNHLIRANGHSITKDKRSDESICILHGKRKDNGDTWVESFSIDDAKQAGIYRNQWIKYPKDMLFARALSRLARQLFPDIIKGCYVQGEISDAPALDTPVESSSVDKIVSVSPDVHNDDCVSETVTIEPEGPESITDEEYKELEAWMGENTTLRQNISAFLMKKWGIKDFRLMPKEIYHHALSRAKQQHAEAEQMYGEKLQAVGG